MSADQLCKSFCITASGVGTYIYELQVTFWGEKNCLGNFNLQYVPCKQIKCQIAFIFRYNKIMKFSKFLILRPIYSTVSYGSLMRSYDSTHFISLEVKGSNWLLC